MERIRIISCGTDRLYQVVHDSLRIAPQLEFLAHSSDFLALFNLLQQHSPHVVLLEVRSNYSEVVNIIKAISAQSPETAVLVLAHGLEAQHIQAALRFGAKGYLLWPVPMDRLADTIQLAHAGKLTLSSEALSLLYPS